jgi:hypothetical protein
MIWINMKSDLQIGNAQYTSAITVIIIIRPLQSFEIDLNLASKHYIQLHLSTPKSWPVPHRFSTLFLLHCVLCQNALSFCILYTLMNYITSHYLSWSLWLNTVCSFWTPILCTFLTGLNFSCLSLSSSHAQFKCKGCDNRVQGFSHFFCFQGYTQQTDIWWFKST